MGRRKPRGNAPGTSSRELGAEAARLLTLDPGPWLSCDDCFEQVDGAVERLVLRGTPLATPFRAHLVGCPACQEEARTLAVLVAEEAGVDTGEVLRRLADQLPA